MKQPCISIIVPIYKVEPYIRKCIESIICQTYTQLEIILVDDGSPDNCGAICDEYARKDSRIRVIHKENGGLSDARNAGLDICTGEYIGFVDSDDWIEPQMYEKLLHLLQEFDTDIAFGGVADDVAQNGTVTTIKVSDYGATPYAEEKLSAMRRYFLGSWAAWDKLYRRELFDEIRFPVGEINEDEAIVLQLLDRCERVCYTNEVFYHYMKRSNGTSITTASFSTKKLAWVNHCRSNLAFVQETYPQLEKYALSRYLSSLLWALNEMALAEGSFREAYGDTRKQLKVNAWRFLRFSVANKRKMLRLAFFLVFPFSFVRPILKSRERK